MRLLAATTIAFLATITPSHAAATCALIAIRSPRICAPSFRECQANVKLGIGTKAIAALVPAHAALIVVSAGSNDYLDPACSPACRRCDPAPARPASSGSGRRRRARPPRSIRRPHARRCGGAVRGVAEDRERLHPLSNRTLAGDIPSAFPAPGKDGVRSTSSRFADLSDRAKPR